VVVTSVLTVVSAMLAIIMAVVAIIVAPIVTTVVVVAVVAIRTGNPFSFLSFGIAICYLYQFANGRGPLAIQLSAELFVL
jgi:hypothetical protein